MNKTAEKLIQRIKDDKKLILIIGIGVLGMVLLLFSGNTQNDSSKKPNDSFDITEIQTATEKKLTSLLETVSGAGKVKVMVTFDAAEEKIYAVDTESESKADEYKYSEEYVIVEESGDTKGLTLKVIAPVIRGVGITCEGASSAVVRQEISKLVSAALGISANKIWVTVMEE